MLYCGDLQSVSDEKKKGIGRGKYMHLKANQQTKKQKKKTQTFSLPSIQCSLRCVSTCTSEVILTRNCLMFTV